MKRNLLGIIFVFVLSIVLMSCASSSSSAVGNMIQTLEDAGYVMEEMDSDSCAYYQTNTLSATYGVTGEVKALYHGYINSSGRWVEVVELKTADQANAYAQAIYAEGATGKLVVVEDSTILITFSTDTINLFPVTKG